MAETWLLRPSGWFSIPLALAACASPPPAAPPAPVRVVASGTERFLPLQDSTVFDYETESALTGDRGSLVMEVRRRAADRAELIVAGRVRRVQIEESGIRLATGGWLLKEPLEPGSVWQGDFGQVRLTRMDLLITVPAGRFAGCLETVESAAGRDFSKQTTTTYCPGVGIAIRRTEVESDDGAGIESIRLRSFGPRVDLLDSSDR